MELAPCPAGSGTGCQGFAGPLPSAFLDKQLKELVQRYSRLAEFKKLIFRRSQLLIRNKQAHILLLPLAIPTYYD